jgi:tetratricopeptide (TPR) repeat protein
MLYLRAARPTHCKAVQQMSPNPYVDASVNLVVAFLMLAFITMIAMNFAGLGRRETNAKCSLAMAFTLIALLTSTVFGASRSWGVHLNQGAVIIVGLVMLIFTIASVVLGIIGLVEVIRRRKRFKKGLKRVITAQVLNCTAFGAMIVGAVTASKRTASDVVMPPLEAAGTIVSSGSQKDQIVSDDWNFRLAIPPQWQNSLRDPKNPLIVAVLRRANPDMLGMVTCETTGFSEEVSLPMVVSRLKEQLKARANVTFLGEELTRDGELKGHSLEYLTDSAEGPVFALSWSAIHRGTIYRIVVTGLMRHREIISKEVAKLREGFSLIDPERSVVGKTHLALTKYESPQFPFSVDLTGTPWRRTWPTLSTEVPDAEFGVQHEDGNAWFCVIPVALDDEDDQVDLKHLTAALSARLNIPFPDDGIYGLRPHDKSRFIGQAFAYEQRGQEHPTLFRVRVHRFRGVAVLIAAWAEKDKVRTDILDEALDGVKFLLTGFRKPSPDSLNERQRFTLALICNGLGLEFDRAGKAAEAKPWFRQASDHWPKDATIASNYVNTCAKLGLLEEAATFVEQHADKVSEPGKLRLLLADSQFNLGRAEEAMASYAKVFDAGHRDDTRFAGYVSELAGRGRTAEALAALERYSGRGLPVIRRAHSTVLLLNREFDKAIEILANLQRELPNDRETTTALADAYFTAQRFTDCIEQCDKLVQAKQDSAYVHRRKGLAEFSLKRYHESKASLERALALEPSSEEIKLMLARVSGMVGQGSNSTVKTEIEAVPIPGGAIETQKAGANSSYLAGYSAWYVNLSQAIAFKKGVDFRTTERATVTVRDQQGVEKFSTLEFRYDPLGEEIFVNSLVVKDANGEPLAQGKVDDSYTVDDGVGEMATQHKILHVPVPGLKPGFTVEYAVTRREPAAKRLEFREHYLARGIPVLQSTIHFEGATSDIKWESSASVPKPKAGEMFITWTMSKPPVYRWEPMQAPAATFLPIVWLGDRGSDWKKEAADYLEQIKERLAIDTGIREQALKIVEGLTDRDAQIGALSRFVQKELTYKALEFGRRARLPNAPIETLRNKYGDCKDHSLLLTQLLDVVGIPARLALVNAGGQVREGLPSLDQFNHLITYVPGDGGGKFIDATNKLQDLRSFPPLLLPNQRTLVLDDENPRLVSTPESPANCSMIVSKREVAFTNEKDADITENLTLTGAASMPIRGLLQAIEPADRNRQLLTMMNNKIPSLDLREAEVNGIDNPQEPLVLRLRYVVREQLKPAGSQLVGTLPAIWERMFVSAAPVERRYTPFRIERAHHVSTDISIIPPKNWQAQPLTSRSTSGNFGAAQAAITTKEGRTNLSVTISQKMGDFEAGRYTEYCDAMSQALALVEQPVIFKRQP